MDRIIRNEKFLRTLVKSKKKEALKLLKQATEDEYRSVVDVLLNAESVLEEKQLKKCSTFCARLKKFKKLTKKALEKLLVTSYKTLAAIIGFVILRLFEQGVATVYCMQNGQLC